jgi:cytochrome P450 PksS
MLRFDFTSQDYLRDPAPALARLSAAGSVVEVRFPIIDRTLITTTGEIAGRVLKDSATFTMREAERIVSLAVTIAVAVNTDGRREVLGMEVGLSGS